MVKDDKSIISKEKHLYFIVYLKKIYYLCKQIAKLNTR